MERAAELVGHPSKDHAPRNTDYKRFVNDNNCTEEGEEASHRIRSLDTGSIQEEEKFDGFYAVCTNLEDDPLEVIAINEHRWHIEECFRVMKSEFKARPVYLNREDRIRVHFLTCFIALIIYRILEKKLGGKFSCREIVQTLQGMHMLFSSGDGYIPAYTRTDITDALHEAFGFRTDCHIVSKRDIKKYARRQKNEKANCNIKLNIKSKNP